MTSRPALAALIGAIDASPGAAMNLLIAYRAEVAHELAEEIRKHWYPKFPGKAEYTQGLDDGYVKAADLIDPEVPGG